MIEVLDPSSGVDSDRRVCYNAFMCLYDANGNAFLGGEGLACPGGGGCLFERERCHLGHFLGGNIECLDLVILRLCSKSLWGLTDSTQIWTQHLISTDTRISNLSKEKHSFTSLCPYRFFHHVLSKEMVIEREFKKGAKGESERKKKKVKGVKRREYSLSRERRGET